MIKFFRHIRKSLLMKNQTGRYFKYAIGEIVLVVIGILIALQINNWNTVNTQRTKNIQLSERLLIETKSNLNELGKEMDEFENSISSILTMLHLMGEDYTQKDTELVDSLLFNILSSPTYYFNNSVLNEALSTGQVASFDNDSLKNLIYSIPKVIETVKFRESNIDHDLNNNLIPFLYNNISLRNVDSKFSTWGRLGPSQLKKVDNRKILSNLYFENEIDNLYYIYNVLRNKSYKLMEQNLKTLLILLEKEINAS